MSKLRFQAHMGYSKRFPENTLPSFEAAARLGYDIVEADTKFTKDNVCVMLHDNSINRTGRLSDGGIISHDPVLISSITLEDVKKYDFGLFKDEAFKGTRIPTLAETLALIKSTDMHIKLDNVYQSFNEEQFEIFCSVIENADMEDRICFTCKTLPYFLYLAERFPRAELHFDGILTPAALDECRKASKAHPVTVWIPYDNANTAWFCGKKADADFCRKLHEYGDVGIWLIGTKEELAIAKNAFGADVIETNGDITPNMLAEI